MPIRLLVIEDDAVTALALRRLIEKSFPGVVVEVAEDGEQGWQRLEAERYQMVLCDWNLPGLSGAEVLERLRGLEEGSDTPFLMLTGRSDRVSVVRALQAGVTRYITKPFSRQTLIDRVSEQIGEIDPMERSVAEIKLHTEEKEAKESGKEGEYDLIDVIDRINAMLRTGSIEFPILPDLAMKIADMVRSGEHEVADLARAIEVEPGISSKLIGVSNSAAFRGGQPNKTLEEAIVRLGMKRTQSVVLVTSSGKLFESNSALLNELLKGLWQHSLASAACSRLLGLKLGMSQPEVLFTMGLLHDIGSLVLLRLIDKEFRGMPREQIMQVLMSLHTHAGAALLREWNFPIEIADAALHHHDPQIGGLSMMLRIVSFANQYVSMLGYSVLEIDEEPIESLIERSSLKIDQEWLGTLEEGVRETVTSLTNT